MKYRGYYITETTRKADIDALVERLAVDGFKQSVRFFLRDMSQASADYSRTKAEALIRLGWTWEQVESLEIEVMQAS